MLLQKDVVNLHLLVESATHFLGRYLLNLENSQRFLESGHVFREFLENSESALLFMAGRM